MREGVIRTFYKTKKEAAAAGVAIEGKPRNLFWYKPETQAAAIGSRALEIRKEGLLGFRAKQEWLRLKRGMEKIEKAFLKGKPVRELLDDLEEDSKQVMEEIERLKEAPSPPGVDELIFIELVQDLNAALDETPRYGRVIFYIDPAKMEGADRSEKLESAEELAADFIDNTSFGKLWSGEFNTVEYREANLEEDYVKGRCKAEIINVDKRGNERIYYYDPLDFKTGDDEYGREIKIFKRFRK